MSSRARIAALICLIAVCIGFLAACGSGGSNGSISTGQTGFIPLGPASPGGVVPGKIQLNLKQTGNPKAAFRAVPTNFTQVRLVGLNADNQVIFTQVHPVQPSITQADVPVTVVTLNLEFLDASGNVVGRSNLPVVIPSGGTMVVDDPAYDNVVAASSVTANFLNGTFLVTGGDTGTVKGGVLNGSLTFDGQGRVTGGNLTRRDAVAQATTTSFTVNSGTYTITGERGVDITLATNRYPLTLHGRASLNTLGESVYADVFGDNGSNDALSGFVYLQKQALSGAAIKPGSYNISGLSVGFFGTPGIYNGNLTLANGTIASGGSLDGPTGTSIAIQGGTYSVTNGVLAGTMQLAGLGNLPFTGSVGSDNYISFNGVSSTSNDFLFFAGIPTQGTISLPNVPGTMTLIGMRTTTGGLDGTASISIGGGTLLGGAYTLYQALTVPIIPTSSTLSKSTFALSSTGIVTGTSGDPTSPARLVRGFFSQDGSLYFGSLDSPASALAGGQGFCVLAK